jgi:hypothetical protein
MIQANPFFIFLMGTNPHQSNRATPSLSPVDDPQNQINKNVDLSLFIFSAAGKPPAWFVFWNQTAAGNSNVTYDHTISDFGQTRRTQDASGVVTSVDYPVIGPSANGSSTLGYTSTTITGIDTFHITVRHEMFHYQDRTASIGAPNPDGDGLASAIEGDQNGNGIIDGGETSATTANTYTIDTDAEYRAYWREGNVWNTEIGNYDSVDWSKGGKQW